ncbi:hypothetical protein BBFL7_00838 [Flavobacteria bacterium BBFL7]|nr:hypothetical protein BBFL7_00838 [Flavobacteria bacterium BBFL7]
MTYLQELTPINRFAHWNALASFSLGTLSLLSYLIFKQSDLIEIGIVYTIVAVVWNSIVLVMILFAALGQKTSFKETTSTIGILLINLPIAFLYFIIIIEYAI